MIDRRRRAARLAVLGNRASARPQSSPVPSVCRCWLWMLLLCLLGIAPSARATEYDLVIYGGTSAGITAAVQAVRLGRTVLLIEPTAHLGGLTASGLGFTDSGDKRVIGGIAREFYRRIKQHYDRPEAWTWQRSEDYARYRADEDAMWTFEPHVAEQVFASLLGDPRVTVVLRQRLDRPQGVERRGQRIVAIRMESGDVYAGRMFIDATYEGDLMAGAGVSYTIGRESNATFGETLNGIQPAQNLYNHRFVQAVDPYRVPGDPTSGLVLGVPPEPLGDPGTGDSKIQAYCYRMCMSNIAANRVPFPRPADYDEQRYELLFRALAAGDLRLPFSPDMMPNGKTDTNNLGAQSTDYIGANYNYPEASYEQRDQIVQQHRSYQQGLMWTLGNHPRVPTAIREQMTTWGLAADEFTDNGHWPYLLYIREARRLVGTYVLTEHDCRRTRIVTDSVGLGSYNMDSHNVQRYITADGRVENEGDVQVSPGGSYLISYGAIVPRAAECENLLVPVCLSASHIAYGSIRMEPVFMILGQSAATAACLALEQHVAVQGVPYADLRRRLVADGQVLDLPATPSKAAGNGG